MAGQIGINPDPFSLRELIEMWNGSQGIISDRLEVKKVQPNMDDICNALGI